MCGCARGSSRRPSPCSSAVFASAKRPAARFCFLDRCPLGLCLRPLGTCRRGPAAARAGGRTGRGDGVLVYQSQRTAWLSEITLLSGRRDDAVRLGERALDLARTHKERGEEAWALRLLGQIHIGCDSSGGRKAEDLYRQALVIAYQPTCVRSWPTATSASASSARARASAIRPQSASIRRRRCSAIWNAFLAGPGGDGIKQSRLVGAGAESPRRRGSPEPEPSDLHDRPILASRRKQAIVAHPGQGRPRCPA